MARCWHRNACLNPWEFPQCIRTKGTSKTSVPTKMRTQLALRFFLCKMEALVPKAFGLQSTVILNSHGVLGQKAVWHIILNGRSLFRLKKHISLQRGSVNSSSF